MLDHRDLGPDLVADPRAAGRAARRLLDAAVGIPFVPADDVPIEPLLFADAEYQAHLAAVKRFDALLQRIAWDVDPDPAGLRRELVGDGPGHALLTADVVRERTWASCMFRVDAVVSGGVLKILESNIGGAIGGINLMHVLTARHRADLVVHRGRVHFDDPFDARRVLYEDACRWVDGPRSVAFLATRREEFYGHPRYWSVETDFMARHGIDARLQEPEELADPRSGFPVALRHFMPDEWQEMGIDLGLVRRAMANGTLLLAPESSFLLQNKRVFAWMSAAADDGARGLDADDRAFLHRHLPWTRAVTGDEVVFRGRSWYLPELLAAERPELVLKPEAGYGGYGVTVGRFTAPAEWAGAVAAALASGGFVVQEYVPPDEVELAFYNTAERRPRRVPVAPVLGFVVFAGRDAGCVVRHHPRLAKGVVNGAQGASQNIAGRHCA